MPASFATIMYAFLGLPLLVVLVFTLLGRKISVKAAVTVGYCTGLAQMVAAILSLLLLLQYHKESISFSQFWSMSNEASNLTASYFSADIFSLIVLFCIGLVIFSAFFSAKNLARDLRFNFLNLSMVLMLGMNGMALVTDLFSLYVFLEATSIAAFVLIAIRRDDPGLEGAFKYLVMSSIASAFILAGLGLIFMNTGSLRYEDIALLFANWSQLSNHALIYAAFILMIVGFSIKAGLVPFHGWLPDAYQGAPASVSIILGGIVTKMAGVYAIIRLLNDLIINQPVVNTCFMILGMLSIFYGAIAAVGQSDFKRILAYSSISQIGYIILAVSCGSIVGYIGAIFHFFNHATFKTTLFVNSQAVEEQTGTTNITELGGLQAQMPVTGITSIVAFLSTAGVPPLAGFWSKLLIVTAVWQAYGGIIASLALLASLFTAAYFLKLQRNVFFGPVEEKLSEVKEASGGIRATEIVLTAITVLMGLIFPAVLLLLQAQGIL